MTARKSKDNPNIHPADPAGSRRISIAAVILIGMALTIIDSIIWVATITTLFMLRAI